jgi:hypothetical protein
MKSEHHPLTQFAVRRRFCSTTNKFLLDYEQVENKRFVPAQPREQRFALHALVNF